jgi:hypothetical protein
MGDANFSSLRAEYFDIMQCSIQNYRFKETTEYFKLHCKILALLRWSLPKINALTLRNIKS